MGLRYGQRYKEQDKNRCILRPLMEYNIPYFLEKTPRLLFISAPPQVRNAATIRGQLQLEVQTSRLLFISALPQCGDYSRAVTIRGAVFIERNKVL